MQRSNHPPCHCPANEPCPSSTFPIQARSGPMCVAPREPQPLTVDLVGEQELVEWVNSKLPPMCLLAKDLSMYSGSARQSRRRTQGLFDFLLDNDARMGTVSINNVCNGNPEKTVKLVRALKTWDTFLSLKISQDSRHTRCGSSLAGRYPTQSKPPAVGLLDQRYLQDGGRGCLPHKPGTSNVSAWRSTGIMAPHPTPPPCPSPQ